MTFQRFLHTGGCGVAVVLSLAGSASANMKALQAFKKAYPGREPQAYSCQICHLGKIGKGGDLNPYGLSVQQAKGPGHTGELVDEDFRTLEPVDADGDKVSNGDELKAGTNPGDSHSTPAPSADAASK